MDLLSLTLLTLSPLVAAQLTPSSTYSPPSATAGLTPSTASPNANWVNVLGNSLWFYDAQRSGKLDAGTYGNRVDWRNDSGLEDGSDWGVDLTGGWYDAGDYIKATFPLTFTLFALSWGALTHGQGYGLAGQTAYLDGTLRWGYDWLIKAHPSDDVLFIQVGSSTVDNAYWGGDQNIPDPRPAYPINSSHPGTEAWASTSSAFSLASMLYGGVTWNTTANSSPPNSPSLANSTYAATLLSHAETLYRIANTTTPYTLYATSIPAVAGAYGASDYGEHLALSALSLAIASNDSTYYADAYQHYTNFTLTGKNDPWNWDSRTPALYVLFAETSLARPGLAIGAGLDVNVTGWQKEVEGYFDRILSGNIKTVYLTKGRLLYFEGDSTSASLNPAMATAMLMFKYAPLASSTSKGNSYISFAQEQVDYLMGKNPSNSVYLVGQHPNSPQNPHSGLASGGTNIKNIRNDPQTEAHVLYGAMVGGPLASDLFWDWRDDYVQTEIALDYNAMIPTLAAMQLINGSSDPYFVNVQAGTYSIPSGQPCDEALPCSSGGLSGGAIAGIVIGVIAALVIVFGLLWWFYRKQLAAWWRRGYRTKAT